MRSSLIVIALSILASSALAQPAPSVTIAEARYEMIDAVSEHVGRAVAVEDVDLRARVDGYIVERSFEEGADVAAGDALIVIDQAPYEAALDAAKARVTQAEAEVERWRREFRRRSELVSRGNISESSVDEAEANLKGAQGELQAAKAAVTQAELDLGYTVIRSPIEGRIGNADVSVGNLVGPASGVLSTVVQLDPIYVTFPVDERTFLDAQQKGRPFQAASGQYTPRLRLSNGMDYEQDGFIDFVDNRVNRGTGSIIVRARFPNPDKRLLPGLFVAVLLSEDDPENALLIPSIAVQEDQVGYFVLVVNSEEQVETRRIETGRRVGIDWIVTSGLKGGERVIIDGLQKVRPGQTVSAYAADGPRLTGGGQ